MLSVKWLLSSLLLFWLSSTFCSSSTPVEGATELVQVSFVGGRWPNLALSREVQVDEHVPSECLPIASVYKLRYVFVFPQRNDTLPMSDLAVTIGQAYFPAYDTGRSINVVVDDVTVVSLMDFCLRMIPLLGGTTENEYNLAYRVTPALSLDRVYSAARRAYGKPAPAGPSLNLETMRIKEKVSARMVPQFHGKVEIPDVVFKVLFSDDVLFRYARNQLLMPAMFFVAIASSGIPSTATLVSLSIFVIMNTFFDLDVNLSMIFAQHACVLLISAFGGTHAKDSVMLYGFGNAFSSVLFAGLRMSKPNLPALVISVLVSTAIPIMSILSPSLLSSGGYARTDPFAGASRGFLISMCLFTSVQNIGIVGGSLIIDSMRTVRNQTYRLFLAYFVHVVELFCPLKFQTQGVVTLRYVAAHAVCGYDCDDASLPDLNSDMVATQAMSFETAFATIDIVVLLFVCYGIGRALVSVSGKTRSSLHIQASKNPLIVYTYLGACALFDSTNLIGSLTTPTAMIYRSVAFFKMGIFMSNLIVFLTVELLSFLIASILYVAIDVQSEAVLNEIVAEAVVTSFMHAIDGAKLRAIQNHVVELEVTFPASDSKVAIVKGTGVVLGKNYFMTARHVVDMNLDKKKPNNVKVKQGSNEKQYEISNIMYFPKENGSDGICVVVVNGTLEYDPKGVISISAEAKPVSAAYVDGDGMRYIYGMKLHSEGYLNVNVNTSPGDSGMPLVNGNGEIIGVHMGHRKGKWNTAYLITEAMKEAIGPLGETINVESVMPKVESIEGLPIAKPVDEAGWVKNVEESITRAINRGIFRAVDRNVYMPPHAKAHPTGVPPPPPPPPSTNQVAFVQASEPSKPSTSSGDTSERPGLGVHGEAPPSTSAEAAARTGSAPNIDTSKPLFSSVVSGKGVSSSSKTVTSAGGGSGVKPAAH